MRITILHYAYFAEPHADCLGRGGSFLYEKIMILMTSLLEEMVQLQIISLYIMLIAKTFPSGSLQKEVSKSWDIKLSSINYRRTLRCLDRLVWTNSVVS